MCKISWAHSAAGLHELVSLVKVFVMMLKPILKLCFFAFEAGQTSAKVKKKKLND